MEPPLKVRSPFTTIRSFTPLPTVVRDVKSLVSAAEPSMMSGPEAKVAGAPGVPATFASGPLIIEGSAALTNDFTSLTTVGSGVNDLIVVNGDLTFNGGSIQINPIGLVQTAAGSKYRLM